MNTFKTLGPGAPPTRNARSGLRERTWSGCRDDRPAANERQAPTDDALAALRELPDTATLRDVIEAVLGERPVGHGQTYANVVVTQRALGRLAELVTGRAFAPWEPAA